MNISILPFTIDAYEEVLRLWRGTQEVGLSESDSEESIRSYLERNPGTSLIVREDEGTLIGAVLCGHDGRRGYIHHLALHPNYRRQGIGRKLVQECLWHLKDAGIQKCHLFIFKDNLGGIEFWKRIGWTSRSDIGVISKAIP